MTDEFNLVPTNNLEKHLDNILRAAQGEQPQYELAPNWRVEQYLAAIQKAIAQGGGSGGGVLVVHDVDGTLDKTWREIFDAPFAVLVTDAELYKDFLKIFSISRDNASSYSVIFGEADLYTASYTASSADGYPTNA